MATFAQLKRFGRTLPGVTEHLHMRDQPSLRANGKMFALWWKPENTTILKLDREHQHMLFEVRPDVFTPCKVGTGTWSYVDIAKLTDKELQSLVTEAWSQVATKKMRERVTSTAAVSRPRRRRSRVAARKGI